MSNSDVGVMATTLNEKIYKSLQKHLQMNREYLFFGLNVKCFSTLDEIFLVFAETLVNLFFPSRIVKGNRLLQQHLVIAICRYACLVQRCCGYIIEC